jgi:type VI secretion system protein ImpL
VVFNPIGQGVASVSLTTEGPWAWFRVLDRARVERTAAPDRFMVTFEVQGMQAVYELQAGSITNPFDLRDIVLFRCPEEL